MNYLIEMPTGAGDIFPLKLVAHAMAVADASVGGIGFRPFKYRARVPRFESLLLEAARTGKIRVCNEIGELGSPEDLVAARAKEGLVEVMRDVHEIDDQQSWLVNLLVKLSALNEWALERGDHFSLSNGQGDPVPANAERVSSVGKPSAGKTRGETSIRAAARGASLLEELRKDPNSRGANQRLAEKKGIRHSTMSAIINKARVAEHKFRDPSRMLHGFPRPPKKKSS